MPAGKFGECFMNSARFMIDQAIDNPKRKLTLVHATVIGTGGEVAGLDYAHAFIIERHDLPPTSPVTVIIGDPWVEFAIDVAADYNNPKEVPLELFRKIGNVHNEIHYTVEEVREMLQLHEHYGPWDDSVSTDTDRRAAESRA